MALSLYVANGLSVTLGLIAIMLLIYEAVGLAERPARRWGNSQHAAYARPQSS